MIRRAAAALLHRLKEVLFAVAALAAVLAYVLIFGNGTDWLGRREPIESAEGSNGAPGYDCEELAIDHVSDDDRVIVLDDGRRLLVGDAYQGEIDGWDGDSVTFCDGGAGHRFVVNHDQGDDRIPVGLLDE